MLLIANHKPQQIRELLDFFHCLQVSVARSEGGCEERGCRDEEAVPHLVQKDKQPGNHYV